MMDAEKLKSEAPPPSDGKETDTFDEDKINGTSKLSKDEEDSPNIADTATELTKKTPEKACWERFLGLGLMIIASICFSLISAIVKNFKGYNPANITAWSLFGGLLFPSIPLLAYFHFVQKSEPFRLFRPPIFHRDKLKPYGLLFFRSCFGASAMICQFTALNYLSLSDTVVICFSTPVVVTFLARCFLREKFGIINILGAVIAFGGVVIIARPPFLTGESDKNKGNEMSKTLTGVAFALTSMLSSAFVFVVLRLLKDINFAVVMLSFGFMGTLICCIVSIAISGTFQLPRSGLDTAFVLGLFCCSFTAQVSMTLSFKFEDAGPLSLIRSFDVVFSFIWQFIFFKVEPNMLSLLGAVVVLSGVLLIGFRKHVSSLPENHQLRKACFILLK